MKKLTILLTILLSLFVSKAKTQICAIADCKTTIQLPQDTLSLNAQVTSSNKISKTIWNLVSGSSGAIIANNTALSTPISNLTKGTYVFSLTATDSKNLTTKAMDTIIVLAANKIPKAIINASSASITLPINTIKLDGSASVDSDGTITNYLWSTGDTTKIINPIFGAAGTYNFSLTVTDNQGATNTASIPIIVNPQIILPPMVTITGNTNVVGTTDTLIANAIDQNLGGSIKQYGWGKLAGVGTQTIIGASTSKAIITGLQSGPYSFKCTVWNGAGLTGSATINFTVSSSTIKTITKVIVTYYYSDGTTITTTQQ